MKLPEEKLINTVLFDLGNTLIYFAGEWQSVFSEQNRVLTQCLIDAGCTFDATEFTLAYQHAIDTYYAERDNQVSEIPIPIHLKQVLYKFGMQLPEDRIKNALDCSFAVSEKHWLLEEDAHAMLTELRHRGYKLGIVSNASYSDNVHRLMQTHQLSSFFDSIIISAEVGIRKPARRIFEIALNKLNADPPRTVMVGDRIDWDIIGGHNAGLGAIWITRRVGPEAVQIAQDLPGAACPDRVVETLVELPDLIDRWK